MQARMGAGVRPGHLVLLGGAPPAKGGAAMPEGGQEWGPTRTLMSHYWDKTPQRRLWDDNSYNHDLAEAREAHWWALAAAHLLEEGIERLSQLATRTWLDDCWHSHSKGHSRRWLRGHQWRHTKILASRDCQKDSRGRWTQSPSPSPTRPWKHVTFQDTDLSSKEGPLMRQCMGQSPNRWKAEECDLGPPPTLGPELEYFLGELTVTQEADGGCDLSQEPFVENYESWLEWRGCQLNMLD